MPTHETKHIKMSELRSDVANEFLYQPSADELIAIADVLRIEKIEKAKLKLRIQTTDIGDWVLKGTTQATTTEICVLSLDPFKTRLDLPINRTYLRDFDTFEDLNRSETELDETAESIPVEIDLNTLMIETIALALDDYPKKPGAELSETQAKAADSGPESKPFASLAALKEKLEGSEPKE